MARSAAPATKYHRPIGSLPLSPEPVFGGTTVPGAPPPLGVLVAGRGVADGATVPVEVEVDVHVALPVPPQGVRVAVFVTVAVQVALPLPPQGVVVAVGPVVFVAVGGTAVFVDVGAWPNAIVGPPLPAERPMNSRPAVRPATPVSNSRLDTAILLLECSLVIQ